MAKKAGRPKAAPIGAPLTIDGEAFRAELAELGFNMTRFARQCGVRRETVERWARDNAVPPWAAWLLDLLQERRQIAATLAELAGNVTSS